jgi:hypothetical protein
MTHLKRPSKWIKILSLKLILGLDKDKPNTKKKFPPTKSPDDKK